MTAVRQRARTWLKPSDGDAYTSQVQAQLYARLADTVACFAKETLKNGYASLSDIELCVEAILSHLGRDK